MSDCFDHAGDADCAPIGMATCFSDVVDTLKCTKCRIKDAEINQLRGLILKIGVALYGEKELRKMIDNAPAGKETP